MQELDRELFEEFKRVDIICRDMFSTQRGVREYIDQMDRAPTHMRYAIPSWNYDYRMLKHVRWLRNQIAHETVAVDCTAGDIDYLRDFHSRLLTQQDPLGVLGKMQRKARQTAGQRPAAVQRRPAYDNHDQKSSGGGYGFLWGAIAVAALILFVVLYLFAR